MLALDEVQRAGINLLIDGLQPFPWLMDPPEKERLVSLMWALDEAPTLVRPVPIGDWPVMKAACPAVQLCCPYQSVNIAPSLAMRSMKRGKKSMTKKKPNNGAEELSWPDGWNTPFRGEKGHERNLFAPKICHLPCWPLQASLALPCAREVGRP